MSRIQAFNLATLSRHFTKEDFYNDPALAEVEFRYNLLAQSVVESNSLFQNGMTYNSFLIGNKKSFSLSCLSQKLVLRTCSTHLKRNLNRFNKSRSQIARELKSFLAEGTPYNIFRLDIKSFFENVQKEEMECKINSLKNVSMHTKKLVIAKSEYFSLVEGVCVPRGLETSSVLSDLYLQEFDSYIHSRSDVFFYSRFVDDILIITSNEVSSHVFKNDIELELPVGLSFNKEKTEIKEVPKRSKAGDLYAGKTVACFDYLGFRFKVIDSPLITEDKNGNLSENKNAKTSFFREVNIDLSPKKVKRIKDKLCKSFYSYYKTGDYGLLLDRIKFLTTNREFVKKDKSTVIPVGIYYNNSACDYPSEQLKKLDAFMRYLLFGKDGRLTEKYIKQLSIKQKKELVKFSFSYGFYNRTHKRFSYTRLAEIAKVWK